MTALSSADPGLPIGWRMPGRWQAARTVPEVYIPAPVGVHDDPGHFPAAHRHGHGQGAGGQLRVVVLRGR